MKFVLNCYCIAIVLLFAKCKKTVDPAWKNDITIINSINQEVTFRLYWSRITFSIKPGEKYTYYQESSDGPTLDFDDSDSIIVTFADGRKKTDYNCNDQAVASIIQNCYMDTISLFNSFRYSTIKFGEHNYMNYYTLTQADYDEAK